MLRKILNLCLTNNKASLSSVDSQSIANKNKKVAQNQMVSHHITVIIKANAKQKIINENL